LIIRWLGAFGITSNTLAESLKWEFTQSVCTGLCAEHVKKGNKSLIPCSRVGLLTTNSAILRKYKGDVYSYYKKGVLVKSRSERAANSLHNEVWVKPNWVGIVVKNKISKTAWQAVKNTSCLYEVPVFILTKKGKLLPL